VLDRLALATLRPAFESAAARAVAWGWRADAITLAGLGLGLAAAAAITWQAWGLGLLLMLLSRVADGLDGAVARQTQPTDRGAFLDIACDFLFYAAIPLAFALAQPADNALPAAVLLAAFIGTGTSFLAFAVLAERRGLSSAQYPRKGFFYLGGLTEATETLACFALMALRPDWFPALAYGFAALCGITLLTRLAAGWQAFGRP
jgi:phosphatidylglycerophosphate synthase